MWYSLWNLLMRRPHTVNTWLRVLLTRFYNFASFMFSAFIAFLPGLTHQDFPAKCCPMLCFYITDTTCSILTRKYQIPTPTTNHTHHRHFPYPLLTLLTTLNAPHNHQTNSTYRCVILTLLVGYVYGQLRFGNYQGKKKEVLITDVCIQLCN
jgi:hypothetical protein